MADLAAWYAQQTLPGHKRARLVGYGTDTDRMLLAAYDHLGELLDYVAGSATEQTAEVPGPSSRVPREG